MQQFPFKVILRKSKRARRLRISITHLGEVLLVKPVSCSLLKAEQFLDSQQEWVLKHLKDTPQAVDEIKLPRSVDIRLLDQTYTVTTSASGRGVRVEGSSICICGADADNHTATILRLQKHLRSMASTILRPQVADVATKMGISFSSVNVRNQISRWGSCSSSGAINLNQKLLFIEPEAVHYVLVHELCHRREMNHSPRFWKLVQTEIPHYKDFHRKLTFKSVPQWAFIKKGPLKE